MKATGLAVVLGVGVAVAVGCGGAPEAPPVEITPGLQAFVGARIIDGTGDAPVEDGVLVVRDGRIDMVGARDAVDIPPDAEQIDVTGRTLMPGMINAHGHVNNVRGLEQVPYTEAHVESQLALDVLLGIGHLFEPSHVVDVSVSVDQTRHDGASGDVDPLGIGWDVDRVTGADRLDPAVAHHQHAVVDRRVAGAIDDQRPDERLQPR